MGSKGRIPPPHLRRPLPGPGLMHPDPFGPGIIPPPGAFPPFDMLPPPEVMEQKLAAQHVEMERLANENQRLAATHGTLRQELAAAQHELQTLHAQIGVLKSDREQRMRGLTENIGRMEAELKATEPVKLELQQARSEHQGLVAARQELMSKMQQLTQDLQRSHSDGQQIPALMSELETLRQEYQHCRATYDYEKKLYNDHLESLQVMEKNYLAMTREVEKLRAELTNTANMDRRTGGPYGGPTGYNEGEASGHHPIGHNSYEDGYGVPQGRALPGAVGGGGGVAGGGGTPGYGGPQSGPTASRPGYDGPRGPGYDALRGPGYDPSRGPGYDVPRGPGYESQKGLGLDAQRGPGYDGLRGAGYDGQRGAAAYDTRAAPGAPGQMPLGNNLPYGSPTPPARPGGGGYEAAARGGNPIRR